MKPKAVNMNLYCCPSGLTEMSHRCYKNTFLNKIFLGDLVELNIKVTMSHVVLTLQLFFVFNRFLFVFALVARSDKRPL